MPSARRSPYPLIEPFNRFRLPVSGGHDLYVEECGTRGAKPVIVLHGGPGGGCSPNMRRYFDPTSYHIILFDQRGCGRSRPHAELTANTTWDLVKDIEAIRRHLGIRSWMVFGGSWGATLGLLYSETYPERVTELILRGVFLMTERELEWFYGGGAATFFPDAWKRFCDPIPEEERDDMIAAYYRRLVSDDIRIQTEYARIWAGWEASTASLLASENRRSAFGDADYARAFARIECHYFINRGFLEADGQILRDIDRIKHIPGVIVQGRYDMVCPPVSAWELSAAWPAAELRFVADAGHALSEPGVSAQLVSATDSLRPEPVRRLRPTAR